MLVAIAASALATSMSNDPLVIEAETAFYVGENGFVKEFKLPPFNRMIELCNHVWTYALADALNDVGGVAAATAGDKDLGGTGVAALHHGCAGKVEATLSNKFTAIKH